MTNVIDSYQIEADKVPGKVTIIKRPEEYTPVYEVKFPTVEPATRAILDSIKEKLVEIVKIEVSEILDPKAMESIKKRFLESALETISKELPKISDDEKKILGGYLVHEMLGLGRLEVVLNDDNLEELVINNSTECAWVFHKKYGWLKTNIIIPSEEQIYNYASLIGRKVGRQITNLDPLMDAHLITGDRVNATLFPISTKGNTITIRKFRREPWTMIHFIDPQNKTLTKEIAALLWLCMQYELNILVAGGTASGKCVSGDTEILMPDGNLEKSKNLVERTIKKDGFIECEDGFYSFTNDLEVLTLDHNLKIKPSKVMCVWKRKSPEYMIKVKTKNEKIVEVTPEHPFFVNKNSSIEEMRADELIEGIDIATPKISDGNGPDIFWDKVIEIEKVKPKDKWVYDFTVEPTHNFIAGSNGGVIVHNTALLNTLMPFIPPNHRIISIEDTRELRLPDFLHWVPLTTREPNPEGKGKVTMLDLLVNSLRMRPDRVVVGEIRRQEEAEVLFEAMHTGHSVYATLHADTAEQVLRRLTNPPIDLPETLLEALHLVIVQFRHRRKGIRRTLQVAELLPGGARGEVKARLETLYRWKPQIDKIIKVRDSIRLIDEIRMHTGMTDEEMKEDLMEKEKILQWMLENNIKTVNTVGKVVADYYHDRERVLKIVNKKGKPEEILDPSLMKEIEKAV